MSTEAYTKSKHEYTAGILHILDIFSTFCWEYSEHPNPYYNPGFMFRFSWNCWCLIWSSPPAGLGSGQDFAEPADCEGNGRKRWKAIHASVIPRLFPECRALEERQNALEVKRVRHRYNLLAPRSLPRVINIKFPLQPHQKYYITRYEGLDFHGLLRWKMIMLPILTTSLLHLSLKGWENVLFLTWE